MVTNAGGLMKECRFCKTQVHDEALKCPACIEWIRPWTIRGPYGQMIIVYICIAIFISGMFLLDTKGNAAFDNLSSTPKTDIVFSEKIGGESHFSVVGQIKNTSSKSIIGLTVEVSFFNKANKLVDVGNAYLSGNFEKEE